MTTIPVGSRWRRRHSMSLYAKVIHVFEYAPTGIEKMRWIIYESIWHSRNGNETFHGIEVLSKSDFDDLYTKPPIDQIEDVPEGS